MSLCKKATHKFKLRIFSINFFILFTFIQPITRLPDNAKDHAFKYNFRTSNLKQNRHATAVPFQRNRASRANLLG